MNTHKKKVHRELRRLEERRQERKRKRKRKEKREKRKEKREKKRKENKKLHANIQRETDERQTGAACEAASSSAGYQLPATSCQLPCHMP